MPSSCRRGKRARFRASSGFTLLEALATMLVLLLIFAAVVQFMTTVERSWKSAASDPFAEAEQAFEIITQHLSVATVEPYQDYADNTGAFRTDPATAFTPDHLARRSNLDFVCGPSAGTNGLLAPTGRVTAGTSVFFAEPRGLTQTMAQSGVGHLLNAQGYFVEFGGDPNAPFFFVGPSRQRWRLKQIVQPSESFQLFATTSSATWIQQLAGPAATPAILAENVVALIVLPERAASDNGAPLATDYRYDSRDAGNSLTLNQLPPRIRVVLAAIDEASATHLAAISGDIAPALIPNGTFQDSSQIDSDITALDASLTKSRLGHRIFQRDVFVTTAAWSNTP